MSESVDVLDRLTGGAAKALKAVRPDVWGPLQESFDALLEPAEPGDLSRIEREAVALRVASLHQDREAIAFYRKRLVDAGGTEALAAACEGSGAAGSARLAALLTHARKVTLTPDDAEKADLARLGEVGLSENAVVSLSQLIAFLAHQLRAAHALRLLEAAR